MRTIVSLSGLILLGTVFGSVAAFAQSVGPDEAIQPNGAVRQSVALTAAQKNAIHNAVFQQRVKPYSLELATAVGAPVPQSVELIDLPDAAVAGAPWAADLKYAMVGTDIIVVVDPVQRRVVDVIGGDAKP
jgi:hypothetical protein